MEKVELGASSFAMVIRKINEAQDVAEAIAKYAWTSNYKECVLRKKDPAFKAVKCEYPERINYINRNNCTFEQCPLIRRR